MILPDQGQPYPVFNGCATPYSGKRGGGCVPAGVPMLKLVKVWSKIFREYI
jgi:hypothetical protein